MVKVDTPGANARGIQPGYLQAGEGEGSDWGHVVWTGRGDPQRLTQRMKKDHHRFTLVRQFSGVSPVPAL